MTYAPVGCIRHQASGVLVVAPNGTKSQSSLLAARVELVTFHDCAKNKFFSAALLEIPR